MSVPTHVPRAGRPLDSSVVLLPLTPPRLSELKALNSLLFPVRYADTLYTQTLRANPALTCLAYSDARPGATLVGAVWCRMHVVDDCNALYVLTLGVLATYRELGIGTRLLEHAVESARARRVPRVFAHVQEGNDAALRLYRRAGFTVNRKELNYYRRVHPPHALLVEKHVQL